MKRKFILRLLFGGVSLVPCFIASAATFNIAGGAVVGLINAINTCNTNNENDVINLTAHGTYTLTAIDNSTFGDNALPVIGADNNHSLTINGNGATILRSYAAGTPSFRIFCIDNGAKVTLSGLTLKRGRATSNADFGRDGGAILAFADALTMNDCRLTNNFADFGGAIRSNSDVFSLNGCTFSTNTAYQSGGAIYNLGNMNATACTFNDNRTTIGPGGAFVSRAGIANQTGLSAIVTFTNCTFDQNIRLGGEHYSDGGIFNLGLTNPFGETLTDITFHYCTIRQSDITNSTDWTGGPPAIAKMRFLDTIIVGSKMINSKQPGDPYTEIASEGYNLTDGNFGAFFSGAGDRINTDPKLDPVGLEDNGGVVETIALLLNSPAIDSGRGASGLPTDARGLPRVFDVASVPNTNGTDGSDVGAFEYNDQLQAGPNYIVNVTSDHDDGLCGPTDCTLHEAINAANANSDESIIKFAYNVLGTINLTTALPNLSTNLTVLGPGANLLDIHRLIGTFRIFTVSNGTTAGPAVNIHGLTISNGVGTGSGTPAGGILNDHGIFTLSDCIVSGNSGGNGAGFENNGSVSGSANATLLNSTFRNNSATSFGGAILNTGANSGQAILTVANCTIADNNASRGAAIYNTGLTSGLANVTVLNCTVSNNSASLIAGAGIYCTAPSGSATVGVGNSIFSAGTNGNFSAVAPATIASFGHNISNDAAGGDTGTGPGGYLNGTADKRNTNPSLDAGGLNDNGGPTPTIALLGTSPAINAGDVNLNRPLDQRGYLRNGVIDIGAFEFGAQPLRFTSATSSDSGISMTGVGVPNGVHTIYYSAELNPPKFVAFDEILADAAGILHIDDNGPALFTKRFYKFSYP